MNKIGIVAIALIIIMSVFGVASITVQAQATPPAVYITDIDQIYGILERITDWLFIFFFAIAIIFILWGAWGYLIDTGEKATGTGKKKLMAAAIAIIIALVARGLPFLLQTIIAP